MIWIKYAAFCLLATAVVGVFIYGASRTSNALIPIVISHPQEGITCASMVVHEGVALSCWEKTK